MEITFDIKGTRPLLMHSAALADPLNEHARAIKAIKANRKRTETDEERAAIEEWLGGLYYDEKVGPFIPGINIEALIKESAKKWRKGKDIERGVMVLEETVPLEYNGPRALAKLQEDHRFRDARSARMPSTGSRVMRVRPRFEQWGLSFAVDFEPKLIERRDLIDIMHRAGEEIGLGDWRPRYGVFVVTKIDGEITSDGQRLAEEMS